jgi:hypothetical protein
LDVDCGGGGGWEEGAWEEEEDEVVDGEGGWGDGEGVLGGGEGSDVGLDWPSSGYTAEHDDNFSNDFFLRVLLLFVLIWCAEVENLRVDSRSVVYKLGPAGVTNSRKPSSISNVVRISGVWSAWKCRD